jgi:nitronate monooxygenase
MKLTSLLGIEYPIIQAPMAGVQGSALAIAVSNAGALGSLPCALLSIEALRAELEALRAGTAKPYNVNFFCHTPPPPDPQREVAWRNLLQPYYSELRISPTPLPTLERAPFSAPAADLIGEFRPAVVSFHFGLPSAELLRQVKTAGARVLASATTIDEALWLEAHGADAVIAQGLEAGGHRGMFLSDDLTRQMGTLALLPQVVRAVRLPVIAAGGIADARGVRAALQLGAAGVQIGTAYLSCPEATTSAVHRAALKSPGAHHTALTNVLTGRPARAIVNRAVRELGPISQAAPSFPLAAFSMAPLRAVAERQGSGDFSSLWAGQNVACHEMPAAELTRELAAAVA